MDDLLESLPDVDEAYYITAQAMAILSASSSNLSMRWIKDQIESTADSETHSIAMKVLEVILRQDHNDFGCFEEKREY